MRISASESPVHNLFAGLHHVCGAITTEQASSQDLDCYAETYHGFGLERLTM